MTKKHASEVNTEKVEEIMAGVLPKDPNLDHNPVTQGEHPFDVFFAPKGVALLGATEKEGSVGRTILWNLITSPFGGAVYPVNPKRSQVLGIKSYADLKSIPEKVDLAVIVTPPSSVPGLIRECGQVGVRGVIVISAGFKEVGAEGLALEQELLAEARKAGIRVIGPNCLGVMSPLTGLNATFATKIARPGNVGFVSQSGALCTAVLDWSFQANVGFSAFLSLGSMADVGWGDLIYYLGNDPHTESIIIYMETIGDARAFLSAAREVALRKPIIVIKPGRTAQAAKAAASHTGSLAGSDDVLEAAFQRSGVLRVESISEMFDMAGVLSKQPKPKGPRLTIVTNAGGPGVIATDALIMGNGQLSTPDAPTIEALNKVLPSTWSHGNPIDIIGDAPPERYAKSVELVANDKNSDGLLVILTPQAMTDPTVTADELRRHAKLGDKPILASWMGGADVEAGARILNQAGIPNFAYPDTAVRAFNYMWKYSDNLRAIYETPSGSEWSESERPDREQALSIVKKAQKEGRTLLTEEESKRLLMTYKIPTVQTLIATTDKEARTQAKSLGFPIVLKLFSETITHKTDVGGVILNLQSEEAVAEAFNKIKTSVTEKVGAQHFQGVTVQPMVKLSEGYEIIIGSSLDPQFGPVILFGTGGQLVEVFKDRSLGLPPLNTTLARRLIEKTKIAHALHGVRGRKPVDLKKLERILVYFSELVVDIPMIKEIDINPMLASADQLIALDARVVLHEPNADVKSLPKPAIRPYPNQYVQQWKGKGMEALIRPIRPEDEPAMVEFHKGLSAQSVYHRYLEAVSASERTNHRALLHNCFVDYDREIAFVAVCKEKSEDCIAAVGRLRKSVASNSARLAILVSDAYQGKGVGNELMNRLLAFAKDEGIQMVYARFLTENVKSKDLLKKYGFRFSDAKNGVVQAELKLL